MKKRKKNVKKRVRQSSEGKVGKKKAKKEKGGVDRKSLMDTDKTRGKKKFEQLLAAYKSIEDQEEEKLRIASENIWNICYAFAKKKKGNLGSAGNYCIDCVLNLDKASNDENFFKDKVLAILKRNMEEVKKEEGYEKFLFLFDNKLDKVKRRITSLTQGARRLRNQQKQAYTNEREELLTINIKKRYYLNRLNDLIKKSESTNGRPYKFAVPFFNLIDVPVNDCYKGESEGKIEADNGEKIYYSCVRKDLVIVQLPVPHQLYLGDCFSNAEFYATLFRNHTFKYFLERFFNKTKALEKGRKNAIKNRAKILGTNGCDMFSIIKHKGFFSQPYHNEIYKTILTIYNPSMIKEFCWLYSCTSDPRLRFSITGKPEVFAGGIAKGHAIAWRLEKCGEGKYIIFFCDSWYKDNKIKSYKNTFIQFLDIMLMKNNEGNNRTAPFFEHFSKAEEQKTIYKSYMNYNNIKK